MWAPSQNHRNSKAIKSFPVGFKLVRKVVLLGCLDCLIHHGPLPLRKTAFSSMDRRFFTSFWRHNILPYWSTMAPKCACVMCVSHETNKYVISQCVSSLRCHSQVSLDTSRVIVPSASCRAFQGEKEDRIGMRNTLACAFAFFGRARNSAQACNWP